MDEGKERQRKYSQHGKIIVKRIKRCFLNYLLIFVLNHITLYEEKRGIGRD